MPIANVTLNNTFDEWRTATNQLITFVNEVETQQLINAVSNTTALTVTPRNIPRNGTLYITLNVSNSVLDTSTLNVATANAVNIVFAALANTDARLVLVSNNANLINSIANAAFIQANTSRVHANAAHASANAGMAIANAAFATANAAFANGNVVIQTAQSAFTVANASYLHANAAHASANAGMSIANGAFIQANTARDHANTAHASANAGQLQANTARVHANTAHASANAALISANAGLIQANTARDHANAAFLAANVANTLSVANTLANGMTQIRSTRTILNFVPTGTIVTFVEDDSAGNRINISSQVIGIGSIGDTANLGFVQSNAAFAQANIARVHANTAHASANAGMAIANASFAAANGAFASANAGQLQANTARDHGNVSFEQANTARVHANNSFEKANLAFELASFASGNNANTLVSNKAAFDTANAGFDQANTARVHANTAHASANAALLQANTGRVHANQAFERANAALPNTSGVSFVGNLQLPTGNLTIGLGTTQGIRLVINDHTITSNITPQIKALGGSQFIQFNANTNFGGWNDLMQDRDLSIIFTRGGADDSANLVIAPWSDSSFGYKQDGAGRHGFNTSNPRHVLDANGSANISGSLLVGAMNVVPTVTAAMAHANAAFLAANTGLGLGAAFGQANTARDHANSAFLSSNNGTGSALIQANTARDHANTAHASANAGLIQANTARDHANAGILQANTARDHANAAFFAANTGLGLGAAFSQANTARVHANASFEQANTARSQANDAYTRANTGVTVIQTDALSSTRYIVFTDKTTGTLANANVATSLSYNPSSGALVATSLKSSALYDSSDRQLLIKDSAGTVVWGN